MAANTAPNVNGSDPSILRQIQRQTDTALVKPASNPTVVGASTTPTVTTGSIRSLAPVVSGEDVIFPQSTTTTSSNSVTINSSVNNDTGDITTVYTTAGRITVNPINQVINQYTSIDSGVSQILAGTGVTITSTGASGTGAVTINATGGGGNGDYGNSNVAAYLPTYTGNVGAGNVNVTGGVYTSNLSATGLASLTTVNVSATTNLGAVGNVTITGGTNGQVLTTNGNGNLSWTTVSGGGGLPLANGNSIIDIATVDGNITLDSNGNVYTFGTDGNFTTPSNLVIGPGPGSGSSILQYNDVLQIVGEGANSAVIMGWAANQSGPDSVATIAMNFPSIGEGNVLIAVGNNATTVHYWNFDNTGNLILPGNGYISNPPNSSLDPLNPNVSTMIFTPDPGYSSQSLVLDPTAPGHIHLRAPGANIDEPYANIFLGGEESSFEVGYYNGSAPNVFVHSGNNTWTFDNTGNLTVPGQVRATSVAGDSFVFDTTITNITTGNPTVVVTFASGIFGAPVEGLVQIYDVLGTDEINDTWWYQSTGVDEITLYTNSTFSTPVDGTTWNAYISGGKAVSVIYNNLNIEAGTVFLGNPNRQWQVASTGEFVAPFGGTIFGQDTLTFEVPEGPDSKITNIINDAVTGTYSSWDSATYTNDGGIGRIDIVSSTGNLRRFVQLYMENANPGTATITINGDPAVLTYSGYNYNAGIFTIYVNQTPAVDPTTVTTITLNAVMRNIMELNDDNNQLNLQSYSGWAVNIRSGYQGDVNINAGDDIFIRAGDKTTTDSTGGQIDIDAGDGGWADTYDSAGSGGDINVRGGGGGWASNAYSAGNGGTVNITGGQGGEANLTGLQNAGVGGPVEIFGGFGGFNNGNISLGQQGGYVRIKGGDSTGEFVGGRVDIEGGWGGPGYAGGNVTIRTTPDGGVTNYDWVFDTNSDVTVPGDILAQVGNDLNLKVYNPNGGGVTLSLENRDVDSGDRTTQIDLTPSNIILTTDFANAGYTWTFDNTGNLTTSSNLVISASGLGTGTAVVQSDAPLILASSEANGRASLIWYENPTGPGNVVQVGLNDSTPGSMTVLTGDFANTTYVWDFDNTGNLTLPTGGNLIVSGSIVSSGASPAPTLSGFSSVSALQFTNGNSNVTINANSNTWTFSSTGNLTLPGNTVAINFANGSAAFGNLVQWTTAPVANTSAGTAGQAAYDTGGNLYVCVSTNTWAKFTGTTSW